jgi:hypothetical protein
MKDFPNAAFAPDTVGLMQRALDDAIDRLPEPVKTSHTQALAETILRSVKEGERDAGTLSNLALLELKITPRD